MNDNQNEILRVETFILQIVDKFAKRKSITEPLSKTLGNYSNNLFLRSVKNVMFENRMLPSEGGKFTRVWFIKQYAGVKAGELSQFLAKRIIKEQKILRSFVWSKNGWGIPPENKVEKDLVLVTKDVDGEGDVFLLSGRNFISANIEKFKRYIYNVGPAGHREKAEKTLKIIYKAIYDAKVLGEDLASKEKNEIIRNLNVHLSVHCVENENLKKEIIDLKKKLENIKRLIIYNS